jgi:secreted PhoX family phosphatase
MLPKGFRSRQIARSGAPVGGHPWHIYPDGSATFATRNDGWILVSNSETSAAEGGGASAIKFRADGSIKRAYRILDGSERNCSGGDTPWGTYLSCEEWEGGQVWECDPTGNAAPVLRAAMGTFAHESACVDPVGKRVYMTEDQADGLLYRFTPTDYPDLSSGVLEAAIVHADGSVAWETVPDPSAISAPTREQVAGTRFDGGEGTWFDSGIVYFTTKHDNRVHAYHARERRYELIYDKAMHPDSPLAGLDGITVSRSGDLYLAEDGDDLDICLITPKRVVSRFLKLSGPDHFGSELTGVVFDPSGKRMYFSSMRSYGQGATYEVTGPFRGTDRKARSSTAAVAATNRPPKTPPIRLRARDQIDLSALVRRGITVPVEVSRPGTIALALRTGDVLRPRPRGKTAPEPRQLTLARVTHHVDGPGTVELRMHLDL